MTSIPIKTPKQFSEHRALVSYDYHRGALVIVGCSCGWRVEEGEGFDCDDQLAGHWAYTRLQSDQGYNCPECNQPAFNRDGKTYKVHFANIATDEKPCRMSGRSRKT